MDFFGIDAKSEVWDGGTRIHEKQRGGDLLWEGQCRVVFTGVGRFTSLVMSPYQYCLDEPREGAVSSVHGQDHWSVRLLMHINVSLAWSKRS